MTKTASKKGKIEKGKNDKVKGCKEFQSRKSHIYDLFEKIVSARESRDKIAFCWGVMTETDALISCKERKLRGEECRECVPFAETRRKTAELIILGGRT